MSDLKVGKAVEGIPKRARRQAIAALCALLTAAVACSGPTGDVPPRSAPAVPTQPPAAICDHQTPGPGSPPAGAVTVDPAVDSDLPHKTIVNPPGTTFWLAPGRHTLGTDQFGQVIPKDGDTYLGAPGTVLDGRGMNRYAFTQQATGVTIKYLTIQNFGSAPVQDASGAWTGGNNNEGVVNSSSAANWTVQYNTIAHNHGVGLFLGPGINASYNCIDSNGQHGVGGYRPQVPGGSAITDVTLDHNEISRNNTDDWETKISGCGCTGGAKFWNIHGANVRSNWVHDNHGVGLWADTNNNDFLVDGNLIEGNNSEAFIYEISYNLVFRNNTLRNNAWASGQSFAARDDHFPVAAIYLSEAGGEPRVAARTSQIEIYGNVLENNWAGITAWEDANRFCNSPANTSATYCTPLVPSQSECSQPGIAAKPLYDDCRWKTQRVDIHDNTFAFATAVVRCAIPMSGRMAVLANSGTYPDWSPYKGSRVQQAITFEQRVRWHNNTYRGPWTFTPFGTDRSLNVAEWQAEPYRQDLGSTFSNNPPTGGC
jgi:Right handed beta helix region